MNVDLRHPIRIRANALGRTTLRTPWPAPLPLVAEDTTTESGNAVLLLSMRRLSCLAANAMTYEFEDVVTAVTDADRIDACAMDRLQLSRRAYKLMRYASGSRRLAHALAPPPATVRLERDYDLFFPTFNDAHELFALAMVPDWRKRCRIAACFLAEVWVKELPDYLLELLADFDHIFLSVEAPVAEVARITGRPCSVLPLAADVLRFSPYPETPARLFDVCYLGRRSPVTHAALVELARHRRLAYYFDTVAASGLNNKQRTFQIQNATEHRLLLATLLQRSRFYVANRSRVNEPELTQGRQELSGRFFEGAAAGAVMFGVPPDSALFRRLFDWPDAIIPVPFDAPDIGDILHELGRDPTRLDQMSHANARHAALRHDWVHRLRSVFETLDLPITASMHARERLLQTLAPPAGRPQHRTDS